MTTPKKQGPKLVRIEIHMVQGLRAAIVEHIPDRGLIPITGKNGSGKTSLLRAVNGAMGGAARVNERPVNDASEDGTGYTDLLLSEGWQVRRNHTPSNPKGSLYVRGPDKGKYGQAKLDELNRGADPDLQGFFGLPLVRKTEILLGLGKDTELPAKLSGKKAAWKKLYDERTPAISEQRRARAVPRPEGTKPEPVDTAAAIAEVHKLQAVERRRESMVREVERAREVAAREASDARKAAEREAIEAENTFGLADHEAQKASSEVRRLRALLKDAESEETRWCEAAGDAANVAGRLRAAVALVPPADEIPAPDLPPDPTGAIESYMAHIASAEAVARSMRPWEAYEAAQVDGDRATAEVASLTAEMDAVEAERIALIEAAQIPVADLSFDSDGVPIYRGRPLEVASGGERVRIALAVAKAAGLGFTLIDEGDVLDDDMLAEIDAEAREEPGVQVLICSVGRSGPGLVQVVDGEARSVEVG